MPWALAGAAIQGVTSLIGAKKQSNAAKEAAKIQQAAADRVAPINRGVYQQQMAGMEPFAALGRQTANIMSRMMMPGVAYTPDVQLRDAQSQYNAPPPWSMDPGGSAATAVPRGGGTLGQLASQQVMLRAPNGSVRAVPANMVEQMLAKGAVRV